jgi:hypothetical protein
MLGNYRVAAQLVASGVVLSSTELVIQQYQIKENEPTAMITRAKSNKFGDLEQCKV